MATSVKEQMSEGIRTKAGFTLGQEVTITFRPDAAIHIQVLNDGKANVFGGVNSDIGPLDLQPLYNVPAHIGMALWSGAHAKFTAEQCQVSIKARIDAVKGSHGPYTEVTTTFISGNVTLH